MPMEHYLPLKQPSRNRVIGIPELTYGLLTIKMMAGMGLKCDRLTYEKTFGNWPSLAPAKTYLEDIITNVFILVTV